MRLKTIIKKTRVHFGDVKWIAHSVWTRHPALICGIIFLMFILSIVPAGFAVAIKHFVDSLSSITSSLNELPVTPIIWVFLIAGVTFTEAAAAFLLSYSLKRLDTELQRSITVTLLNHANNLPVSIIEDQSFQDTTDRIKQQAAARFSLFVTTALKGVAGIVQTGAVFLVLIVIEPLALIFLPPVVLPYLVFRLKMAKRRFDIDSFRVRKRRWTRYLVDKMVNPISVPEIRLLGLTSLLMKQYDKVFEDFLKEDKEYGQKDLTGNLLFALFSVCGLCVLFVLVMYRSFQGALTIGEAAAFAGAAIQLRRSLENTVFTTAFAQEHLLHIMTLKKFLETSSDETEMPLAEIKGEENVIELEDVIFSYPGIPKKAIDGVSLRIEPGEHVVIVGENGAGKTSLLKLIAGIYRPASGKITLNNVDLKNIKKETLYSRISFLLQEFGKYETSAADNIAYGDWGRLAQDFDKIYAAANKTGAHKMIQSMPNGYMTKIGRLFGEYNPSEGQWQKMALSRILARKASIVLLDEPSSHMDVASEKILFENLRKRKKHQTIISVSHRFSTIHQADRIVVLAEGKIVESGSHEELFVKKGRYYNQYRNAKESYTPETIENTEK